MQPGTATPDQRASTPEPSIPEPSGAEPRLTVAAAARRLGVAPATLRTWDRRYGIGPSEHEPGRHRRYAPDDLARLELMQHALLRGASPGDAARYARAARLPRPDGDSPDRPRPLSDSVHGDSGRGGSGSIDIGSPVLMVDDDEGQRVRVGGAVLRLPGACRAARGLGRAALSLDGTAMRRLLNEAIDRGGIGYAWEDVTRPVLHAVGQRWADTGAGVEIEHLISECVVAVFGTHAATAPAARTPRPVLLAGMPGELHTLPMAVLGAALADRRVECRSLGPNLPSEALVAAIRRTAPAVVVLWAQLWSHADAGLLRGLPRTRPRFRIYVAGPGWAEAEVPPRVVWLGSLVDAEQQLVAAALL